MAKEEAKIPIHFNEFQFGKTQHDQSVGRNPMDDTVFFVEYGSQYPCTPEVVQGTPGSALELILYLNKLCNLTRGLLDQPA